MVKPPIVAPAEPVGESFPAGQADPEPWKNPEPCTDLTPTRRVHSDEHLTRRGGWMAHLFCKGKELSNCMGRRVVDCS